MTKDGFLNMFSHYVFIALAGFCFSAISVQSHGKSVVANSKETTSVKSTEETLILMKAKKCYGSVVAGNRQAADMLCMTLQSSINDLPKNSSTRVHSQTALSIYLAMSGKTQEAARDLSSAIKALSSSSNESNIAKAQAYNVLGAIYINRNDLKEAGEVITKALLLAKKTGHNGTVIENLTSMVNLTLSSGDNKRALDYAIKTVRFAESLHEKDIDKYDQVMFVANRTLAMAYAKNGNFKEAINNSLKAELFAKSAFSNFSTLSPAVGIKNDIASYYRANKEYDKAIVYAEEIIKLIDSGNVTLKSDIAFSVANLIELYTMANRISDAAEFADKYGERVKLTANSPSKVRALGSIGMFYMKNTTRKDVAKEYIINATLVSNEVFGSDAPVTNDLAGLSESKELAE